MADPIPVLIIDDDEQVRRAFSRILARAGLRVLEAEDGARGLERCDEFEPGVVFVDIRMPVLDGLQVLTHLKERHPDTPVVVVSGHGTMSDAVEALRRGAWDFVSKPVDSEVLIHAARRGLERFRLLRQNREYAHSLQQMNWRLSTALEELRSDGQGARQLQFQLLPEDGLRLGHLACFRRLYPSQLLSGDFVDYFPLGQRFAGMYLADVAGKGAASALITAILVALIAKYREALNTRGDETILKPEEFLKCLDQDLALLSVPNHVTLFYVVIDLDTGKLCYGNAGAFPYPLLGDTSGVLELDCPGRPLNLPGRGRFGIGDSRLSPGQQLLLASDGVLELPPRTSYHTRRERLGQLLKSATTLDEVVAQLGLAPDTLLQDDVALLLARWEKSS